MNNSRFKVNINFNLRKPGDTKLTAINAVIRFNNEKIVISGIDKIHPSEWRFPPQASEKAKNNVRYNFPKININNSGIISTLKKAELLIDTAFNERVSTLNRYPETKEEIKELQELCKSRVFGFPDPDTIMGEEKAPKSDSFLEYMQNFINQADEKITDPPQRTFIKNSTKHRYKHRSLIAWRSYLKEIKDFCSIAGRIDLKFNDIDLDFYESFEHYMAKKGFSSNYFGAYIKTIKKFMGESEREGFHDNKEYLSKEFVKTKAKADGKALTTEQLRSLAEFDFSNNPVYDNARDLFLVGCWTGLRVGDYTRLKRSNISNDGILDIKTSKQEEDVAVPILPELKKIIDKYKDTETGFPKAISDVELNENIKEICRLVGEHTDKSFLEIQTKKTKLASGSNKIEKEPLYKFISTHVGRRSFCTNAIMMGIPSEFVKKISGHKSDSAFWAYVKIKPRDSSKLALKAFIANNQETEVANG